MEIPAMTDPLGKYWDQPNRSAIKLYEGDAIMDVAAFDALKEYSSSTPSGVYEGKMWKCRYRGKWWLRWYWQDMDGAMWIGLATIAIMGTVDISTAGLVKWRDETIAMIPMWLTAFKVLNRQFDYGIPTHRP